MILACILVFVGNILIVIYAAVNDYLEMGLVTSFTAGMLFFATVNLIVYEIKGRKDLKKEDNIIREVEEGEKE